MNPLSHTRDTRNPGVGDSDPYQKPSTITGEAQVANQRHVPTTPWSPPSPSPTVSPFTPAIPGTSPGSRTSRWSPSLTQITERRPSRAHSYVPISGEGGRPQLDPVQEACVFIHRASYSRIWPPYDAPSRSRRPLRLVSTVRPSDARPHSPPWSPSWSPSRLSHCPTPEWSPTMKTSPSALRRCWHVSPADHL